MTVSRPNATLLRALLLAAIGLLAVVPAALAAPAQTTAATRLVRYDGWSARVPATWPVFRLDRRGGGRVCVRFDRHAVYLGRPGATQRCPAGIAGRTEAVLVQPRGERAAAPTTGAVAQRATGRVLVTVTWDHAPAAVASALGSGSVRAAGRRYARRIAARLRAERSRSGYRASATARRARRSGPSADAVSATAPGGVYTGLGFDACSAPSQTTMTAWAGSPFRAIGVYIGGANMACPQTNLTASWVSAQSSAGWRLIPIYVGLQAPGNGCGCAAFSSANATADGTAAAQDAISEAQALGLGTGNPVYYDMENYSRSTATSAAVIAFLGAWTATLHGSGYLSGVYGSELSAVEDLVAAQGTAFAEPDDIWVANWNGQQSTSDPAIPSADWADHQRLHQYRGGHSDDYGGASLSIDSDYVDAATASPGATTSVPVTTTVASAPTVAAVPQPNGTTVVRPVWRDNTAVSRWQIEAGDSPTALEPVAAVTARRGAFVARTAWSDYSVQAYDSAGVEIGSSATVAARPHVALYGHTAFVAAHGPGGLPVRCFEMSACRVATIVTVDGKRVSATRPEAVPAGGGIVHFGMTAAWHRLITEAGNAGLDAVVSVHAVGTATGTSTTVRWTSIAKLRLTRFTALGAGPERVAGAATGLEILGGTDFVSHGWTGGILVACEQATPCTARPTVRIGSTTVATAATQTIGGGELGYLGFRMTAAGRARLLRAHGNQLGVSVQVSGGAHGLVAPLSANAQLALDAF